VISPPLAPAIALTQSDRVPMRRCGFVAPSADIDPQRRLNDLSSDLFQPNASRALSTTLSAKSPAKSKNK
jgi:hypothetical protein